MPFGAAAILGGSTLIGSLINSNASSDAASTTARAARQAAALQGAQFGSTSQNLLPFLQSGTTAGQVLSNNFLGVNGTTGEFDPNAPLLQSPMARLGPPPTPDNMPTYNMPAFTAGMFHHSPGYSAALQGGTEALQNAGTTTTGARSGNVLKALTSYGTQAANQDYQQAYQNYATNYSNQFSANNANFWNKFNTGNQNYWNQYNAGNQQNQNIFNWLSQLAGSGQNAGANLGGLGATAAGNAGNALIGAGTATAAGQLGSANAFSGGLNNLSTMLARPNSDSSLMSAIMASMNSGSPGAGTGGLY